MNIIKILRTGVFATAAVGLMTSASLSATTIAQYTFASNLSATTEDANLTASAVTIGSGLAGDANRSSGTFSLYARTSATAHGGTISLGSAIPGNDYFSFTVGADSGFEMDLTSFEFDLGYTRNGGYDNKNLRAYVLTSIDGFTTGGLIGYETVAIGANTSSAVYPNGTKTISLAGAQFQDITSNTEFRLYLSDDTNNSNVMHRIDNLTLNGEVVAVVPEPGNFALIGGLLALGWVMIRRRA